MNYDINTIPEEAREAWTNYINAVDARINAQCGEEEDWDDFDKRYKALEEAEKAALHNIIPWIRENPYTSQEYAFKAGAEWQKEQMIAALKNDGDLPIEFIDKFHEIDRNAFQNGQKNMKEQMMEGAVEGEVCGRCYGHLNIRFADGVYKYLEPKNISHIPADVSKYNIGDKVKIIIVKEGEK